MLAYAALCAAPGADAGQLGALVSPGALSKAHATVKDGITCTQCHEAGKQLSARKCLECHKPIQDRIGKKTGVHRAVTTECLPCHTEHAGADAQIRRINTATFDHVKETGFPLDGKHAAIAKTCEKCHKTRSFVENRAACVSCHADPHKGTLGATCTACHSAAVAFKDTRKQFDHTTARYTLAGAHLKVACEKCHVDGKFRGIRFESCASCHQEPHKAKFGPTCTNCHVTDAWATKTVEHEKTRFPLVGAHIQVACAKCHPAAMTKPLKSDTCASCHVNVHKDSVKDDCKACHTETTFKKPGEFDHAVRTGYKLEGKHAPVECAKCHTTIAAAADVPLARKVVDFSGASTKCASCHEDKHKGDYGARCDACHVPAGFKVEGFTHTKVTDFYGGQHTTVTCVRCHGTDKRLQPTHPPTTVAQAPQPAQPALARLAADVQLSRAAALTPPAPAVQPEQKTPTFECASCHWDAHLGQVGASCDRCHAVEGAKFKAVRFSHDKAEFPLTGKHEPLECAKCHTTAVRAFPAATGSAVQYHPLAKDCVSCHKDPHLGQVGAQCETCHATAAFAVENYKHQGLRQFFAGSHGKLECIACHKKETGQFPAGQGTAIRFRVGTTCEACHKQF